MTEVSESALLEVRQVTKRFPGVTALRNVSLTLGRGEVLAVIGENGAGKSTLMKILAGVQEPDSGQVVIDGADVTIDSVQRAQSLGVALIHQELNLSDNLDVGANIFLGREPVKHGLIDRKKIRDESTALLKRVGLNVSPDTIVSRMPIGQQQLVEIACRNQKFQHLIHQNVAPLSNLYLYQVSIYPKAFHSSNQQQSRHQQPS